MINLTSKQEAFCQKYAETLNASKSYRQGYSTSNMKPATITRKAKTLMDNKKVDAKIQKLKKDLWEVSEIKKERLPFELKAILEAQITDYFTFENGSITLKDLHDLPEDKRRAIESIRETKYSISIKMHSKDAANDKLSKLLGYYAPTNVKLKILLMRDMY